jgi:beta-glucuronidase
MRNYPQTTYDFFPYSGLQRPVLLHSVPAVTHIDDVTVRTAIEGEDGVVYVAVVATDGYDGAGTVSLDGSTQGIAFANGEAETSIRVPHARFWSPADPHLYPLAVTLADGVREIDSYTLDIGIRTVEVSGDRILLNGQPIQLNGFGKHEDFPLSGRGLNLPALVRDHELMAWVGANSYRTAHYPYSDEAMHLADRLGVLVINEIPAVGLDYSDAPDLVAARQEQCLRQLGELVARDKNHPSTILWSVANEPFGGGFPGLAPPNPEATATGTRCLGELVAEAKRLDGTRPVTFANFQGGPLAWIAVGDVACVNRYNGWYSEPGRLAAGAATLAAELDAIHAEFGKPIVISEFGADTAAGMHANPPEMWSEEYQVEFLRGFLEVAAARPFVAGLHVWNFADFKTTQGIMRASGLNQKGVFTRDRRPKMAAHFLRSRWKQE